MTFIGRASIDFEARLRGVILRAQTGRKERFNAAAQLGPASGCLDRRLD